METTSEWIEYGEARVRVLHAIESRPQDGFTPAGLARMLGLPLYEVRGALAELTADGQVLWLDAGDVSALQLD